MNQSISRNRQAAELLASRRQNAAAQSQAASGGLRIQLPSGGGAGLASGAAKGPSQGLFEQFLQISPASASPQRRESQDHSPRRSESKVKESSQETEVESRRSRDNTASQETTNASDIDDSDALETPELDALLVAEALVAPATQPLELPAGPETTQAAAQELQPIAPEANHTSQEALVAEPEALANPDQPQEAVVDAAAGDIQAAGDASSSEQLAHATLGADSLDAAAAAQATLDSQAEAQRTETGLQDIESKPLSEATSELPAVASEAEAQTGDQQSETETFPQALAEPETEEAGLDPASQDEESAKWFQTPSSSSQDSAGLGQSAAGTLQEPSAADPLAPALGIEPTQSPTETVAESVLERPAGESAGQAEPSPESTRQTSTTPAAAAANIASEVSSPSSSQTTETGPVQPNSGPQPAGKTRPVAAGGTPASAEAPDVTQHERVRLVERVSRSFSRLGPEGGQINLRLHPAQLGSLAVNVRMEGRSMSARLSAESQAAREIILEGLPILKQRLAEQGIEVQQFQVEVAENGNDASFSSFSNDTPQQDRDGWQRQARYQQALGQRVQQTSTLPATVAVPAATGWATATTIDVQA